MHIVYTPQGHIAYLGSQVIAHRENFSHFSFWGWVNALASAFYVRTVSIGGHVYTKDRIRENQKRARRRF